MLACATQQEIADAVDVDKATANRWIEDFLQTSEAEERNNWHNFDPPIYNIWKQQKKSGDEQFGQWVVNAGLSQLGTHEIKRDDRSRAWRHSR